MEKLYDDLKEGLDQAISITNLQGNLKSLIEQIQEENKSIVSAYEQVVWERDVAIDQLKQLGYGLGEKIDKENDRELVSKIYAEIVDCGDSDNERKIVLSKIRTMILLNKTRGD